MENRYFSKSYHPRRDTDLNEFLYSNTSLSQRILPVANTTPNTETNRYDDYSKQFIPESHSDTKLNDIFSTPTSPNLAGHRVFSSKDQQPFTTPAITPTVNRTTTYSAVEKETSQVQQLLTLVKEMKHIDIENIESFVKNTTSTDNQTELNRMKRDYDALKETYTELLGKYQDTVEKREELVPKSKAKQLIKEAKEKAQREQEEKLRQMKELVMQKENEIKYLKSEKDSALSRLSKEMGDKLNDNNPGIADLSDPNRSTKVAEKYNSLYDNEWTDALESLTQNEVDEEGGIRFLLEIKKHIYSFCIRARTELIESVQVLLTNPASSSRRHIPEEKEESQEDKQIRHMLDTCIKMKAEVAISNLQMTYRQMDPSKKPRYADRLPEYVNKCIEVCWLMNTHNPPLAFAEPAEIGQRFDRDKYKEFTKQGDTVSFVVWLPLLIERDGAVLSKGVVQPVPRSSKYDFQSDQSKEKGKVRSRRETDEERFQRLLLDDNKQRHDKNLHNTSDEENRFSGQMEDRYQYDKDRHDRGHVEMSGKLKHSRYPQNEQRVDEMFKSANYRAYSPTVISSTAEHQSTYGLTDSKAPYNTREANIYGSKDLNSRASERPSSAYTGNHSRQHDEYHYRRPLTSDNRTAENQNTATSFDVSKAELFRGGKVTYALYNKKLYALDKNTGSWRFSSGFQS